jgi:hypothetical protein
MYNTEGRLGSGVGVVVGIVVGIGCIDVCGSRFYVGYTASYTRLYIAASNWQQVLETPYMWPSYGIHANKFIISIVIH